MKRVIAMLAIAWLMIAAPVNAQTPEESANAVSEQIMSPFCPGVTLHECPSREALRLRDRIEAWFAGGLTHDAVMSRLESEYGPQIRAVPDGDGAGLLGWLLPTLSLVTALGLGAWLTFKWTRSRAVSPPPALDEGDLARVEDELAAVRGRS